MMQADKLQAVLAPGLREQVEALCAATDAAQSKLRLANVDSEPALAEVAQHAGNWEIRLAAAQRISDPDLLLRVVEATRHRDKRVFRHCSDLLRERRRTLGHAMRAAELAAAFRRILAAPSDRQSLRADRIEELETELNDLRQHCGVPQDCLDLAAAARNLVEEEARAQRDLGSDATQAESLCAQIGSAVPAADGEIFRARLRLLVERSSRRAAKLADHPTAVALARSIERASAVLNARAVESTAVEAKAVETRAAEPARSAPSVRKTTVLSAGKRQAARELLERLAQQLQAGQYADAEETERRISAMSDVGRLPESMQRQLRRERAQLGRMRDWARWGNDQSREQLIQAAQDLLHGERDPEDLAGAVTGLRVEWKRLDATRHASRKHWERFDAVLTQAFRPVVEFRARRASAEKAAAAAKASLCDQCEAWATSIDWQHADHRAVAARRQELGKRWRALPFAGFRAERQLRKRFDKPARDVDERLGMARRAETSRREALIGQAEALREAPQLGDAIKAAVALQASWKDGALGAGLASREEQVLWRRFRGACDALFARRDAQRNARAVERTARESERSHRQHERKALAARQVEAARNRFELLARDTALAAAQASAAALDKGRAERETLLLDLELALDLPSPASASGARRARQLLKLQERFRPGNAQSADPEALIQRWYASVARSDPGHDLRMSAIVEALIEASRARRGARES